ncbi:MAG: class I SAM-dependent methyltransferase [Bdellovibrionota bacterium]
MSEETEFFSPALGQEYGEFWDKTAATIEGARYGVGGYPFGKPPSDYSLFWQGLAVAKFIQEHLDLSEDDELLEVGIGIGRIARHLLPLVREYHAADISTAMLLHAAAGLRGHGNLSLHRLESCDLRIFPSESFDKVFFQHVLIHLDPEDVFNYLREARRVLRPGGRAYFQFYNLLHEGGFREFIHAADQTIVQGGRQRGAVRCHTAEEVRFLVERAGLEMIEEKSHLERVHQRFSWHPDPDWKFYLIAVAGRPESAPKGTAR